MRNIKKVSWMKLVFGVILICGITACSSLGKYPEEGQAAHKTFVQKCSQCHSLPHPGRHTAEQWDHVLGMMVGIMKERNVSYTRENMTIIREYLHRNAR